LWSKEGVKRRSSVEKGNVVEPFQGGLGSALAPLSNKMEEVHARLSVPNSFCGFDYGGFRFGRTRTGANVFD
jgi:hypothetical protein